MKNFSIYITILVVYITKKYEVNQSHAETVTHCSQFVNGKRQKTQFDAFLLVKMTEKFQIQKIFKIFIRRKRDVFSIRQRVYRQREDMV